MKELAMRFIEVREYFTALDMADAFGMKMEGADVLLDELEKIGIIINVSFKSDKVEKYTRVKAK